MVVVVVYAPDAQYEEGSTEGSYSQRLGERAKASGKGAKVGLLTSGNRNWSRRSPRLNR